MELKSIVVVAFMYLFVENSFNFYFCWWDIEGVVTLKMLFFDFSLQDLGKNAFLMRDGEREVSLYTAKCLFIYLFYTCSPLLVGFLLLPEEMQWFCV